jgi:ubiquinone/menaquinone biosynthesis C-methylase UbiE
MAEIRFDDGASYERMMGVWSRLAGAIFLDWLAPPIGLRWIDVGCGNGAFTELLIERCAPADVQGIDPSEGQLAFARTRPAARPAEFRQGDAMALPFPADSFDAAVMALVLVFVPDPAKGVEEMVRVVNPAARSRLTCGTCWVADFPWIRSMSRCVRWVLRLHARRGWTHPQCRPYRTCGRAPVSRR